MVSIIDILVNKHNLLDENYTPDNLVYSDNNENNFHKYVDPNGKPCVTEETLAAFRILQQAALVSGLHIIIDSGYRSFEYQKRVWNHIVETKGLEHAKKFVAPPGASEHQTGLAVDIAVFINNKYDDNITEDNEEYKWMIENAHKYGFVLRYPKGKEKITGYNFEPWHFRYLGVDLATKLHQENITLEEFYQKKEVTKSLLK